jgi:hypothetical protein
MPSGELDVTCTLDEFAKKMVVPALSASCGSHTTIVAGPHSRWKCVAMSRAKVSRTRAEKSRMSSETALRKEQEKVIEYLQLENQILREKLFRVDATPRRSSGVGIAWEPFKSRAQARLGQMVA